MAEFTRKKPSVRFTIPDRPTVRQQLQYIQASIISPNELDFIGLWRGALTLILEWDCELMSKDVDIDQVDDPQIAELIVWVGLQVRTFINKLESLPKNS